VKLLRKIKLRKYLSPVKTSTSSQRERLAELIRHANTYSPFYAGCFKIFLQTEENLTNEEFFYAFSHLPIVEKHHLDKDYDAFKCTQGNENTPIHVKDIIHSLLNDDTAQQDSTPELWNNAQDFTIFVQSMLQAFRLNGWKDGEPITIFYPNISEENASNKLQHMAQQNKSVGITIIPTEKITKESVIRLLSTLKSTKTKLFATTPSIIQNISHMMQDASLAPLDGLPYINLCGEHLTDCSKSFIQQHFPDSDIQTSYGTKQTGIIAHQKGFDSVEYKTFSDLFYIEQGPKNSILVTPYDQASFPLIRYCIQDLGRIKNHKDGTQTITSFEGKNTDYVVGADGYMYCTSFFNNLTNEINKALNNPIIDFSIRHNTLNNIRILQLNFVLSNPEKIRKVQDAALETCKAVFSNYDQIDIAFHNYLNTHITKQFKTIDTDENLCIEEKQEHRAIS